MKEYFIKVNNNRLITNLEGAVENDHDSMVVNCDIDVEASSYLFKLLYPDNTKWVKNIVDNKIILPQLSKMGNYQYEISMYKNNGRLTTLAKGSFFTRKELINVDEEVEHDDRVPVLDQLISETNNLDVTAERVTNGVEIEVTKKDGTTQKVVVQDGAKGEQGLQGIKGDKGEKGDQGIQGIQGVKGDTGEKGPKGDKGDRGETGPKGDTGATGPQGPQGPAGEGGVSLEEVKQITGELENLETEDKTDLVSAINEVANSSGGSTPEVYVEVVETGSTSAKVFNFNTKEKGFYYIPNNMASDKFYYKVGNDTNNLNYSILFLVVKEKISDIVIPEGVTYVDFAYTFTGGRDGLIRCDIFRIDKNGNIAKSGTNGSMSFVNEGSQTFNGEKAFTTIPKIYANLTPTLDNQLVNKKYVDDNASGISIDDVEEITGNLENLSTEDKTNLVNAINEIANSSGGDTNNLKIFPIYYNSNFIYFNRITDEENLQVVSDFLNYCKDNNGNAMLSIRFNDDLQLFRLTTNVSSGAIYLYGLKEKVSGGLLKTPRLVVEKTTIDGKYKATQVIRYLDESDYAYKSNYLAMNNTTAYTPSAKYHPATKKYVDDSIASAITTTLGGSY